MGSLWHYSLPTRQEIACQQIIFIHQVQLSRQSEKTKPSPLLHMSHEKDQGHLGAGEDGVPGYGVARDAEQQVLELEEGIIFYSTIN